MDFLTKKLPDFHGTVYFYLYGARGRTRTGTVSLPTDFESVASTSFTTRALLSYYISTQNKMQYFFYFFNTFFRAKGCKIKLELS